MDGPRETRVTLTSILSTAKQPFLSEQDNPLYAQIIKYFKKRLMEVIDMCEGLTRSVPNVDYIHGDGVTRLETAQLELLRQRRGRAEHQQDPEREGLKTIARQARCTNLGAYVI